MEKGTGRLGQSCGRSENLVPETRWKDLGTTAEEPRQGCRGKVTARTSWEASGEGHTGLMLEKSCPLNLPSIRLTSSSRALTFFWIPGCAKV